jgi:hypothetical protein
MIFMTGFLWWVGAPKGCFYRLTNWACVVAILCTTSVIGCSSKLDVTGQVTLDNKPLENGTITFFPADGQGPSAGNLISRGRYSVEMLPGRKLVRIEGYKTVGTIKVAIGPKTIDAPDTRPIVPKKYNSDSKLEVSVDGSHLEHDFALEGAIKVTGR